MKKFLLLSGIFVFVLGIGFFSKELTSLTFPIAGYWYFQGILANPAHNPDAYFGIYSYVPYALMGIGLLLIIVSMLFPKKDNVDLPKWRFKLPQFKTWKKRRLIAQSVVLGLIAVHIVLYALSITNIKAICPMAFAHGAIKGVLGISAIFWLFILIATLFGGRFLCGWLCVFAPIQEYADNILTATGNKSKTKKQLHSGFIYFFAFLFWGSIIFNIMMNINNLSFNIYSDPAGPISGIWKYIGALITMIPLVMFFIYLWGSRFFCRNVCPIGGLLQLYSKFSFLKVKIDPDKCTECLACSKNCQMGVNIDKYITAGNTSIKDGNCIVCGECIDSCPQKALSFGIV